MRSLGFTATGAGYWNQMAELCCSCGLCTLYACPEELFPKEACDQSKQNMRAEGVKYVQKHPVKVHPMKEGRRVPLKMLMKKLKVDNWNVHTPFVEVDYEPSEVKLKLKQAVGEPSIPTVSLRDKVSKGDVIAKIPDGKPGSTIHASISGVVIDVNNDFIRIIKN
jgi:Na+-translocating ferredoxin:NAD+ oxidoreductase RnfC subunit